MPSVARESCRKNPRDDFREVYHLTYEFDDGLVWTHIGQSLNNQEDWALGLRAYGELATAVVNYRGKSYLHGGPKHYGARNVESLYDQGAIRNIATFYENIVQRTIRQPHRAKRRGRRPYGRAWSRGRQPPRLRDHGRIAQGEQGNQVRLERAESRDRLE